MVFIELILYLSIYLVQTLISLFHHTHPLAPGGPPTLARRRKLSF